MVADMVHPGTEAQKQMEASLLEGLTPDEIEMLTHAPDVAIATEEFKDVKEPHWLFDTVALFDRLKSFAVVVKEKQELVPRCVLMEPVPGGVMFRVNTSEAAAEVRVDLGNTQNVLQKTIIVDFKVLFSVIRNSGQRILFREKGTSFVVTVLGGEVEFENYNLEPMVFRLADVPVPPDAQKVEGGGFQTFLARGQASMALAARPEDRKVRVDEGMATSNFLSTVFVQTGVPIKSISLRAIDLVFLRWMLEGITEFHFWETTKRYHFSAINRKISLPKIDTVDLLAVRDIFMGLKRVEEFSVSPAHFYRVVTLVKQMIGGTGIVKIRPEGGKLYLQASTKTSKALKFPIATAPSERNFTISSPIVSLATTAGMFRKDPVVTVAVDDKDRMIFEGDNLDVVFGSLSA